MRNHDAGAVQAVEGVGDLFLGHVVQRGGRFVQDEDGRLLRNNACDQQALFLPARDGDGIIGENRLHAQGHGSDVIRQPGSLRRRPGLFLGKVGP